MPPPNHYFEESPQSRSDARTIDVALPDVSFSMRTDRGVFSHGRLDTGTAILLREAPPPPPTGTFVDLGCGAGPIALTLAMRAPLAAVLAVDVNARARTLCSDNADRLGLTNVTVAHPDEVPADLAVDLIWSNPPIRIGKPALHAMLDDVARPTYTGRVGGARRATHISAPTRSTAGCGRPGTRPAVSRPAPGYRLLECRPVRFVRRRSQPSNTVRDRSGNGALRTLPHVEWCTSTLSGDIPPACAQEYPPPRQQCLLWFDLLRSVNTG